MKLLSSIFHELLGLFIDDGSLALQLVLLILATVVSVRGLGLDPLLASVLLLLGCIVVLALSLSRAARR